MFNNKYQLGVKKNFFQCLLAVCLALFLPTAQAATMTVFAAASLTNAFNHLAQSFMQKYPQHQVVTSYAASDVLLQQIIHGAPAQVFAAADEYAMLLAEENKVVIPSTRKDFATNEVVLIVPKENPLGIRSISDLPKSEIRRIAYGNPKSVPAGRYTQQILQNTGEWGAVIENGILGQNVRQVLDYVARGEVDAGFVFRTDALQLEDKVAIVESLQAPNNLINYPIAIVSQNNTQLNEVAKQFIDFVLSHDGQAILKQYGFGPH